MPVVEGFAYNPGMRGLRQEDDESGRKYTARPCLRGKKKLNLLWEERESNTFYEWEYKMEKGPPLQRTVSNMAAAS